MANIFESEDISMKDYLKRNKIKGFTLVELLAVIAVLGLILIIAVPKVLNTLNTQKKRTLELTARSIIKAAEEKYIENTSYGITEEITCESVVNITSSDYESCEIEFDNNTANVTIEESGGGF